MIDFRLSTIARLSKATFDFSDFRLSGNFRLFRLCRLWQLWQLWRLSPRGRVAVAVSGPILSLSPGAVILFPLTLSRDRRIGTRSNDTARRSNLPRMAFLRFDGVIVPLYYKIDSRAFLEPLRVRQNNAAILQAAKIKPRFCRGYIYINISNMCQKLKFEIMCIDTS